MKKTDTLKKNYEFKRILKKGKYLSGQYIECFYMNNNLENKNLIGIAISSKIAKANKRNKIKRLIREGFYSVKNELKKGYDIVFLWNKKSKIKYDCFFDIKQEIRDCFEEAQLLEKK